MKPQIHTKKEKFHPRFSFLYPKIFGFLLIMLLMVGKSWGQYAGTGTFNKITSLTDLTDGYYVIVNETDAFAMNNSHNGTLLAHTAVTPASSTLTDPATSIVWKIETNGSGRTIYNEGISKYVSYTGSSNNIQIVDSVATNNQRWTFTYVSSKFTVMNLKITTRQLSYNNSSPRFVAYGNSGQEELQLYKMSPPATPAIALSDNGTQITAGDVVAGTNSHVLSSFKLAVTTADATLNEAYFVTSGNYQAADINGSGFKLWYNSSDNFGTASQIGSALASTSTGSGDILGFTSLNQSILNGSSAYFWVSADIASGATVGRTISLDAIANADLTFASGNKSGSSAAGGTQTIIAATTPIITVGELTAFGNQCIGSTYGPNSFSISGSNLTTANVTVSALSGFTFSITSSGTYTNSLSLTQGGGTFSQTVYVKFSPSSVQSYNGNITVGGGGASSQDVTASGAGINTAPSVATFTASLITATSASSGGNTLVAGCANITAKGVVWGTSANPTVPSANSTNDGSGTADFTSSIAGLSPGTTYYYRAYATSTVGNSYGTNLSFTTLKIAPTTQASNITFASVGNTSMTVNWTNGNGNNRIVIMNTTNSFTNPTDGIDPTANAAYGGSGEQVVYNGTANTVDISSLSQNTEYWFRIYEYNNTGANTKYITSTATDNPKSESTIDGPCVFEDFTNSNATASYADGSFVGNNGITWTYVASRDENGDANNSGIYEKALMLRRSSDNSKITSSAVAGGIGDFSVKLYKGFTGGGDRQVELFVNGVSKGTSTPFDDFNEHIFSVTDINVSGDVVIEIRNITSKQVIVDDISWTCYEEPPTIILSDNGSQITAGDVVVGTTNHILSSFKLAVTTADATLNEAYFATSGNYLAADINGNGFKLWYKSSDNFGTASQIGSALTPASTGSGDILGFTSLNKTIISGSTAYFWVTSDIVSGATVGRTISLDAIANADLTFASGSKSGSSAGGGTQTIIAASAPIISVGEFTAFGDQCINTTSSEKTYTVSGTNLTADISLIAPTGFEISKTSGSGFGAGVSLTQSGGNVNSTTIYVRFIPSLVQSYTGNITHNSTGATQQDVAASGTGINTVPSVATLTASSITATSASSGGNTLVAGCANITAKGVVWGTSANPTVPSANSTDNGSGTADFTSSITGLSPGITYYYRAYATSTAGTSYGTNFSFTTLKNDPTTQALNITFASVGTTSMTVNWTNGNGDNRIVIMNTTNSFTNPTDGTDPTANAAYGGSGEQVVYNGSASTVDISSLSQNTEYWFRIYEYNNTGTNTKYITSTAIDNPKSESTVEEPCFFEDFSSITVGDNTSTSGSSSAWGGNSNFNIIESAYQAGGALRLGKSGGAGSITTSSLSGVSGNVTVSFDVKGWSSVEGDVVVTLNAESQTVSYSALMGDPFENKSILFSNVSAGSTFKIETTSKRAFIDNVKLMCAPLGPEIIAGTISSFGAVCTGSISAEQSYNVSGSNLTDNIIIVPPTGFEISTGGGGSFVATNPITLTQVGGTVASTPIYVRFNPSLVQSYTGNITHNSIGATEKLTAVSGVGADNLTPSISNPSSESITSTSAILGGNITVLGCTNVTERGVYWSTTAGFADGTGTKVSEISGPYSTGVFTINVSGLLPSTTYYYKAFATNSGGTTYTSQESFVTATPLINVGTVSSFANQCINTISTEKSFVISGTNLIADITISAPAGFEISTSSGTGYTNSLSLVPSLGTLGNTIIYVRFFPSLVQTYLVDISAISTSAVTKNISVTGTGISIPTIPVCEIPPAVCQGLSASIIGAGSPAATTYTYWTAASAGSSITTSSTPPGTVASNNLTTPTSLSAGTYTYYVQAENSCGSSATRQAVIVSVNSVPDTPLGTINPAANPACGSTNLSYSNASASFYWQTTLNGVSTSSSTTSPYTVSETGTYYVRGYNGSCWSSGSLASSLITINDAPFISTQPTNKSVLTPATATFAVVATGTDLIYQWQLNTGSGWNDISAATSDIYTTNATTLIMDGYQYRCVVSGTCGPSATTNEVTLNVSEFTFLLGDFRPSYMTGLANNGAWQYFDGTNWIAVPDGKAPANTTTPIGRIIIDQEVTGAGNATTDYNCDFIIMSGGNLILQENNDDPTAIMIAAGKKLEVLSGGILTIEGDFAVASTGYIIARDGAEVLFNQNSIHYNHKIWGGTENFEAGSTVTIEDWKYTGSGIGALINGASTPTISVNSNSYTFGNLVLDVSPSDTWSIVGGSLGIVKLCENDFIITNVSSYSVLGATNKTGTNGFIVNGNMIINDGPFTFGSSFSTGDFNHQFAINGDFECKSDDELKIHTNGNSTPTTLNGSVTFKGDVKIAPSVTSFTNDGASSTPARMSVNFEGGNIATPKLIEIAPVATAINMNIKANSARKLSGYDLTTNSVTSYIATVTVETGAALHFGWANDAVTPLVIKQTTTRAGTNKFDNKENSTLIITSLDGIQQTSSTTGNVQYSSTNKAYAAVGTYWYVGKSSQVTGDGLNSTANAKVLICDLIDNNTSLTLSGTTGFTNATTISVSGGKLDIRKGQFIETVNEYVTGSTGTLHMAEGTLYKVARLSSDANDLIPRMAGATYPYNLTGGTIELNGGLGTQILRGGRDYYSLTFSGGGTKNTSSAIADIGDNATLNQGLVTIKDDNTILDVTNSGFTGNAGLFMMDNSKFRMSKLSTTLPELLGTYTLSGGTIELYGTEATQTHSLRGGVTYNNIELNSAAANIGVDAANIVIGKSFSVNGTMNVNSPTCLKISSLYTITGVGTFEVKPGGTLKYGSTDGITTTGTASGNIQTTNRIFNSTASYGFVGAVNQNAGSGLPSTMINMYVDKGNTTNIVSFPNSVRIENVLSMHQGHLDLGSNLLELGTSTTALGTLTHSSGYVVGKMRRWFNGTNAGVSSGLFPIGVNDSGLKNRNVLVEYTSSATAGGSLTTEWIASPMGFAGLAIPAANTGGCTFDVTSTSEQGYWQIDNASDLTDGAYTLSATGESINIVTDLAQLTLLKRVGSGNWMAPGTHISPSGSIGTPTVSRSGLTGWSNFGLGGGSVNPLPVEMLEFFAICSSQNIEILWSTASETNSSHFTVEYSLDAVNWNYLGSVRAAGNSNSLLNYKFSSNQKEAAYFRLIQVDFDGKEAIYGPILNPCKDVSKLLTKVYPNPFHQEINLIVDDAQNEFFVIEIFDINGRILERKEFSNQSHVVLSTQNYSEGVYSLRLITRSKTEVFKLIKQ